MKEMKTTEPLLFTLSSGELADFRRRQRITSEYGACYGWTGALTTYGYAVFIVKRGRRRSHMLAHRYAWAQEHKSLPMRNVIIRRECTSLVCTNPDHLMEPVYARGSSTPHRQLEW